MSEAGDRGRVALAAVALAALAVWLWVTVPLALGRETFFFRDVFALHLPLKAFGARELAHGEIPAFNPTWGLGQPFRGNPQALAFYPDNVLYVLLPFWSAFNLHYALHWLLALLTMTALVREHGVSRAGSLLGGIAYAGCGWMLTSLSFYHTVTVSAWWPLVLWGGLRGRRAGVAAGGIACGLALLGGEPLIALLGCAPLLLVAVERHGWRRGMATSVAIGLLGLAVALPQVVATARILPFTFRGGPGVPGVQVGLYALHPLRLVELLVPLPFGWPGDLARFRYWAASVMDRVPLILSLYPGAVAVALAPMAGRRRLGWGALAVAGLLLAWLGGVWSGALQAVTFGFFRFPEKFVFWTALAVPVLAGHGLDRVVASPRRWARAAAAGAALAAVGAALLFTRGAQVVAWLEPYLREKSPPGTARTQLALWILAAVALAVLLALAAWAARRRSGAGLVAVELLCLLQLAPLVLTDSTAAYRQTPPWTERVGRGTAVLNDTVASPFIEPPPGYATPDSSVAYQNHVVALDFDPVPGILDGLSYPMAPDMDGLFSPLTSLMLYNLPFLDVPKRVPWLQSLGVEAVATVRPMDLPGVELADRVTRFGVPTFLYRVKHPAPEAWWPEAVTVASNPMRAFGEVSRSSDPVERVVVPEPLDHHPGGRVHLVAASPDRLELEVDGPGGLAMVRRAYQPQLVARTAGGERLTTLPANLNLLGIVVPAGHHRVVVAVSAWPEAAATFAALLALLAAGAVLWREVREVRR